MYYVQYTVGSAEHLPNIDVIVGPWGEGTSPDGTSARRACVQARAGGRAHGDRRRGAPFRPTRGLRPSARARRRGRDTAREGRIPHGRPRLPAGPSHAGRHLARSVVPHGERALERAGCGLTRDDGEARPWAGEWREGSGSADRSDVTVIGIYWVKAPSRMARARSRGSRDRTPYDRFNPPPRDRRARGRARRARQKSGKLRVVGWRRGGQGRLQVREPSSRARRAGDRTAHDRFDHALRDRRPAPK